MSYHGIYPELNKLPDSAESWRMNSCFKIDENLRNDVTKYSESLLKNKKKLNKLRIASSLLTGSSTALSVIGASICVTAVGILVGGPLVAVGTVAGSFLLITSKFEKNTIKKIVRNEKLLTLVQLKLSTMQNNLNKCLRDGKISEEEFSFLNNEYQQYQLLRSEIEVKEKKISMQEMQQQMKELGNILNLKK